jgi:hypothetical protein
VACLQDDAQRPEELRALWGVLAYGVDRARGEFHRTLEVREVSGYGVM